MDFKPLNPPDFPRLKPYFHNQQYELCAYTLLSILVWQNDGYHSVGTINDGTLFIGTAFKQKMENNYLILPLSPHKSFTPRALFDLAHASGFSDYWFIPESYLERQGKEAFRPYFTIHPQPEYDDYIYEQKTLADLKGNRFSKKRNLIRQFEREFVYSDRAKIEPLTPNAAEECIAFVEAWCRKRACDEDDQSEMAYEKQAVLNTIAHLEVLEVNGLLLRIDGKVCALGIGADLTDEMGVLHFEKAFTHIKGLYQYFDRQCARHLFGSKSQINKESDMGESNLARAKKSYHPDRMIRSFRLTLKAGQAH